MKDNALRSFAGHPLKFRGELLGVVAMFGRRPLSEEEFARLAVFAHEAAIAIKNAQLFTEVERLKNRLQVENLYLQEAIKHQHNFEEIIDESQSIKVVLRHIEQVAPTDSTVLILGDTGTGKELIARAIHNLSSRMDRPLVRVNCGTIPANLVESELFGHEKGSFTGALQRRIGRFELANSGTIFLDEVGELPLNTQVKLLRVLQEREFERVGSSSSTKVGVRVIAATNRDLHVAVKAGSFRADLLYRLNVFPIKVPPPSARASDIPLLVNHFITKFSTKLGKRFEGVSQTIMDRLMRYAWPGNIRELENVIERATVLSKGPWASGRWCASSRELHTSTAVGRYLGGSRTGSHPPRPPGSELGDRRKTGRSCSIGPSSQHVAISNAETRNQETSPHQLARSHCLPRHFVAPRNVVASLVSIPCLIAPAYGKSCLVFRPVGLPQSNTI